MAEANNNFAATITKASGKVSVIRDGKYITLDQGDSVYATDTIETNDAAVELTFADGAISMLSPKTTMTVEEFSFSETEPSFVLNLAAGAMRSISGEVVEQNPDAFKVVTPKATVGIRGTDWVLTINPDGSQTVAVLSLSQGHNVSVTGNNGQIVSLTTANQGATIGADADGNITPYTFTPQEVQELVQQITAALGVSANQENDNDEGEGQNEDDTDGSEGESTSEVVLELDAALVAALSDDSLDALEDALADFGVEVSLGEDLTNNSEFGTIDEADEIGEGTDGDGDGGLVEVTTDGSQDFYADAEEIIGDVIKMGRSSIPDPNQPVHNLVAHRVTITSDILSGKSISADVGNMDAATVYAGSDEILGQGITGGTVTGDVISVAGGTLFAGNDTMNFTSMDSGYIYGDANTVTGQADCGNDIITITGSVDNNSFIYGDVNSAYGSIGVWGSDTINIGGNVSGGSQIFGDDYSSNPNGGIDNITVSGDVLDTSSIWGGGGNDIITVTGSLNNTEYNVSYGILSGYGNDVINVGTLTQGRVYGGAGNDTINIGTYVGGKIEGGDGSDVISITNQLTADLDVQNEQAASNPLGGTDIVYLKGGVADGVTINLTTTSNNGNETDGFYLTGVDNNTGFNATNVTINASTHSDTIKIGNMTGGSINGAAGNDTISVSGTMSSGTIDQGSGGGSIYVGTLEAAATINGGNSDDRITIGTYNGGTIDGDSGTDTLNIINVTGDVDLSSASLISNIEVLELGTVNGSTITLGSSFTNLGIDTMIGGIINTFNVDSANVSITNQLNSTITINGDATEDTIMLKGGTGAGARINLDGSFKFVDASGNALNFTNITHITGSDNADSITVGDMGAGSITSGKGADTIVAGNLTGTATIYARENNSIETGVKKTVTVEGLAGSSKIYTNDGGDSITITGNMSAGNIYSDYNIDAGNGGADTIKIEGTMSSGLIESRGQDDIVEIATLSGGTIDLGGGANSLTATLSGTSGSGPNVDTGGGATLDLTLTGNQYLTITDQFDTATDKIMVNGEAIHASWFSGIAQGSTKTYTTVVGGHTLTIKFETAPAAASGTATYNGEAGDWAAGMDSQKITMAANVNGSSNTVSGDSADLTTAGAVAGDDVFEGAGGGTFDILAGATVYGDAKEASDIAFTCGNDRFNVGTMNGNSALYGDVHITGFTGTPTYGNDIISVNSMEGTASIHGDGVYDTGDPGGSDIITVGQMLATNASISAGGGDDVINVTTLDQGRVEGEGGHDKINITSIIGTTGSGASVRGDYDNADNGNDTITIGSIGVSPSIVSPGETNLGVVNVYGSSGDDVITVAGEAKLSDYSQISGGNGNDSITIGTFTSGTIEGDSEDTIPLNETAYPGNDTITITTMNGGTIDTESGNDLINITTITGGEIHGGAGTDTLAYGGFNGSSGISLDGYFTGLGLTDITEIEFYAFENLFNGGSIQGVDSTSASGNDGIIVNNMTGGSIEGKKGNDSIIVKNMTAGELKGDEGNDNITAHINNKGEDDAAKVTLGEGDDTLNLTWGTSGTYKVTIADFNDAGTDKFTINGNLNVLYTASTGATLVDENGNETFGTVQDAIDDSNLAVKFENGSADILIYFG